MTCASSVTGVGTTKSDGQHHRRPPVRVAGAARQGRRRRSAGHADAGRPVAARRRGAARLRECHGQLAPTAPSRPAMSSRARRRPGTTPACASRSACRSRRTTASQTLQPSPLNLSRLFWSWNAGYKFMRLDIKQHRAAARLAGAPGQHRLHARPAARSIGAGVVREPQRGRRWICPRSRRRATWSNSTCLALFAASNVDTNTDKTALGCMSGRQRPRVRTACSGSSGWRIADKAGRSAAGLPREGRPPRWRARSPIVRGQISVRRRGRALERRLRRPRGRHGQEHVHHAPAQARMLTSPLDLTGRGSRGRPGHLRGALRRLPWCGRAPAASPRRPVGPRRPT